jgi:hypothetical protein
MQTTYLLGKRDRQTDMAGSIMYSLLTLELEEHLILIQNEDNRTQYMSDIWWLVGHIISLGHAAPNEVWWDDYVNDVTGRGTHSRCVLCRNLLPNIKKCIDIRSTAWIWTGYLQTRERRTAVMPTAKVKIINNDLCRMEVALRINFAILFVWIGSPLRPGLKTLFFFGIGKGHE